MRTLGRLPILPAVTARRIPLALFLVAAALAIVPRTAAAASNLPWSLQSPPSSPHARHGAAATYDPAAGKVILFGGQFEDSRAYEDTWIYNGTNWIPLLTAHTPPPRSYFAMAYDPAIGKVVLFGGSGSTGTVLGETWTYDGHDWSEASPATSPPPLEGSTMVYDPAIGKIVLFGGADSGGHVHDETWTYDGSEWVRQTPATSPPAREDGGMAYDSAIGRVVLFGGALPFGLSYQELGDTWTYDGSEWVHQVPANSPQARSVTAMTYDSSAEKVLLFGGYGVVEEEATIFADTWTYDGSEWTEEEPAARPPARSSATLTYDPATGRDVLFGGEGGIADDFAETWTYGIASPPRATVGAPVGNQTYTVGQAVPTQFHCEDGIGGTGIESCTDSGGSTSGTGQLDTGSPGAHTYTVTARSRDGEVGTSQISYTVVPGPAPPAVTPPPPAPTCRVPGLKGRKLKGAKRRIRAAECRVGTLRKRGGATAKDGKVVGQHPRAGASVPAGTKVRVTLAPGA
jgi:hypothetical protein